MARAKIGVEFDPVNTAKVDAAFARLQAKAKGVDFGGGARSLEKLSQTSRKNYWTSQRIPKIIRSF